MPGPGQFDKEFTIDPVTVGAYCGWMVSCADRVNHRTAGFMQVGAVVKPAVRGMGFQVRHVICQLHWIDLSQAELLKTG